MNWKTIRILSASAILIGCDAGGMQTPSNTPVMPQQGSIQLGQWEFTISSASGNEDVFVESDLTSMPVGGIVSNTTATALYWNQTGGSIANLYSYCLGLQATFSVSGNIVTVLFLEGTNQVAKATAILSPEGKSVNGSFQLSGATVPCGAPLMASGTFTGQVIAPLNGTYKGSLSDGNQWTIQIMQNSDFNINASGTTTVQGVTTNFSFGSNSASPAHNDVIGATVTGSGNATNVNGTQQLQVFGHFIPDASQVSFVITSGQNLAIGTLMKQ
jgi:hypothetical protein